MNTVLVTGSAGAIGTALRRELPGHGFAVRGLDRRRAEPVHPGEQVLVGDVLDHGALAAAVDGVDAVVHLASLADEAPLDVILDSHVRSTAAVLEAARRAGVSRAVLASSNHAVGFTPRTAALPADAPPRPDTFYGVGKVAMEALGRLYVDRYGLAVACLRIGSFLDRPRTVRHLSTWLSAGDAGRLVTACLTAPDLTFATVWGISANTRGWWDHAAGRALGYEPRDDAEAYADEVTGPTDLTDREHAFVGGPFTGPRFDVGDAG